MASWNFIKIGSNYVLLPVSTKLIPELMLTSHEVPWHLREANFTTLAISLSDICLKVIPIM